MTVNCNRHFLADREGPRQVLPADWPQRHASAFVTVGPLKWHIQFHPARRPAKLTLVLLHGTGSSTHSWSDMIEKLTGFACVLAVDLPGHGFTTGADPRMLTLPRMADELHKLLLAIGMTDDIVFIGHSAGAPLAIQWALDHGNDPSLAFRLVYVVGLNPSLVPPPPLYTTMLGPVVAPIATSGPMTEMLAFIANKTSMVEQLLDSTESKIPPSQTRNYRFLFSRPSHVQGAMGFMAGADLPSILSRGKALKIPMGFLIGAKDSWVKELPLKQMISESFPDAKIITWPGGHLLHEERPQAVAELIQTLLEGKP